MIIRSCRYRVHNIRRCIVNLRSMKESKTFHDAVDNDDEVGKSAWGRMMCDGQMRRRQHSLCEKESLTGMIIPSMI